MSKGKPIIITTFIIIGFVTVLIFYVVDRKEKHLVDIGALSLSNMCWRIARHQKELHWRRGVVCDTRMSSQNFLRVVATTLYCKRHGVQSGYQLSQQVQQCTTV